MTVSTLTIQWSDLMNFVAVYLGMGRESDPASYSGWSADNYTLIDEQVQAGYRQFLWPPPLPGERKSHEWSFLRTYGKLTTVADKKDYTLPDDVGAVIGCMTFDEGEGSVPLVKCKVEAILRLRQYQRGSGSPTKYAVNTVADPDGQGQMKELMLWPTPDAEYNLRYPCYLMPNMLSSTSIYPVGGAIHSETLKQSCLAAAEVYLENTKGEQWDKFMERLQASIRLDRQTMGPDNLGYFGKSRPVGRGDRREASSYYVTYEGSTG